MAAHSTASGPAGLMAPSAPFTFFFVPGYLTSDGGITEIGKEALAAREKYRAG